MYFSFDLRRARKGDCFLVHFGTEQDPGLILVDGGPRGVYAPHLKPRLMEIRKARKLDTAPLPLDLLMVSHVDDDHIQGVLDLTKELIEAQQDHRPQLVQVMGLWHNSFDAVLDHSADDLTSSFKQEFTAALGGELPSDATLDDQAFTDEGSERPDEEVIVDTLKVLASIEQGYRLRTDAERLNVPLNPQFHGGLIVAKESAAAVSVGRGLTLKVAGPLQPALANLRQKHEQWLADLKAKGKRPEQALAAYVDTSVPNLSSIVVLAECGGKRMLLTGDARGDKILEGLETAGVLEPGGTLHVDLLKVPHHGSSNNLDPDFFERIRADHYVFSGNGENGNPERETLEMLLAARPSDDFLVHLTYPIEELDVNRKDDWSREQSKELGRKSKNPALAVRADWAPDQEGLAPLLAAHASFAAKIRASHDNDRHVIDLLDPLPF